MLDKNQAFIEIINIYFFQILIELLNFYFIIYLDYSVIFIELKWINLF